MARFLIWRIGNFAENRQIKKTHQYYLIHYRTVQKRSRSPNSKLPMHSDDRFTKFNAHQSFPLYGMPIGKLPNLVFILCSLGLYKNAMGVGGEGGGFVVAGKLDTFRPDKQPRK